jgi:hypothetical protein
MMLLSQKRLWLSRAGYFGLALLIALHVAFWRRAGALLGYWGHLDEASRWFQVIDLISMLVLLACLFGSGWKRWVGSALGLLSLMLSFGYAMGL